MQYRILGKTNFKVSEIGIGTWQVGGKWGSAFDEKLAESILESSANEGINFIDTADVYSDGESEKAIGRFLKKHSDKFYVATKCGRQLSPHTSNAYTPQVLRKFVEDSLLRLGLECLDLIQLHCPPTEVYYRPEIFGLFDDLKREGKIKNLGISVEKIEEALKGIEFENVNSVQIIFNMFRQRPSQLFFEQAKKKNVGIIARVPLASGLLSGNYNTETQFSAGDHRTFNRNGEFFDKGETFSGVDYELGLAAVKELKEIFEDKTPLSIAALKWILSFEEVSCVIPGASNPGQIQRNVKATDWPSLDADKLAAIKSIYNKYFINTIHHWW